MFKSKRVLVCGGRDYHDEHRVYMTLDTLLNIFGVSVVIHGGAPGADTLAASWAQVRGIKTEAFIADWLKYPKSAGPIRNRQMLDLGRPDLILAFPGGAGTAHMVRIAREAGKDIIKLEKEP
jgi:predicted Rossmann-fold nucleotide-binding protein